MCLCLLRLLVFIQTWWEAWANVWTIRLKTYFWILDMTWNGSCFVLTAWNSRALTSVNEIFWTHLKYFIPFFYTCLSIIKFHNYSVSSPPRWIPNRLRCHRKCSRQRNAFIKWEKAKVRSLFRHKDLWRHKWREQKTTDELLFSHFGFLCILMKKNEKEDNRNDDYVEGFFALFYQAKFLISYKSDAIQFWHSNIRIFAFAWNEQWYLSNVECPRKHSFTFYIQFSRYQYKSKSYLKFSWFL